MMSRIDFMNYERLTGWCDRLMVFSFYALIYFLPISIALTEIFTATALFFWILKRVAVFYRGLKEVALPGSPVFSLSILRIFGKSFKPASNYLNGPITAFLFFALISVVTSQFRAVSWEGFLGKVLQNVFIYFNFIECMNSRKRLKTFLNIFFISSFLIGINGIYQYYFGQEFIHGHIFEGRISSSLRQANDLGVYLVIVNAVLLSVLHFDSRQIFALRKHKAMAITRDRLPSENTRFILHMLLFVITLSCLGLTYSRGAWISLLLAALFLGLWKKSVMIINVVVMILFLGIFYPQLQAQRNVGLIQTPPLERQVDKTEAPSDASKSKGESSLGRMTEHAFEVSKEQKGVEKMEVSVPRVQESFSQEMKDRIVHILKGMATSGRNTYWKEALRIIKGHPIFGVGVNAYSLAAPQYKISWGGYPHNCYLQMLAEIGIPGFLCFLWILFRLFRNSIEKSRQISDSFRKMLLLGSMAGLGGFLIHSSFDTFFYSVQLGSLMWLMMGFIVALQNVGDKDKDNNCGGITSHPRIKFPRIRKEVVHTISIFLVLYIFIFLSLKRSILNSHYAEVFYNWSVQCVVNCPPKERLKYLKRALLYNPNFSDAHFQLGKVYEELGYNEKAIGAYRRAAELDHSHQKAYFQVGYHYFKEGELDVALRYLAQAYRQGNAAEVNYYLGRIYEERKDYKQAVYYYGLITDHQSHYYHPALARAGASYCILGLTDDAIRKVKELRSEHRLEWADQLQRFVETNQYPEFLKEGD